MKAVTFHVFTVVKIRLVCKYIVEDQVMKSFISFHHILTPHMMEALVFRLLRDKLVVRETQSLP